MLAWHLLLSVCADPAPRPSVRITVTPTCMLQLQGGDDKSSLLHRQHHNKCYSIPLPNIQPERPARAAQPAAATPTSFVAYHLMVWVTEAGKLAVAQTRKGSQAYQCKLAPEPALAGYWCTCGRPRLIHFWRQVQQPFWPATSVPRSFSQGHHHQQYELLIYAKTLTRV